MSDSTALLRTFLRQIPDGTRYYVSNATTPPGGEDAEQTKRDVQTIVAELRAAARDTRVRGLSVLVVYDMEPGA